MQGSISTPRDNFRGYFSIQNVTVVDNLSIAKNDQSIGAYDVLPKLDGFEPVGILDYTIYNATNNGTGLTWVFPYRLWIDGNKQVALGLRNTATTVVAKIKFAIKVLYIRTTA